MVSKTSCRQRFPAPAWRSRTVQFAPLTDETEKRQAVIPASLGFRVEPLPEIHQRPACLRLQGARTRRSSVVGSSRRAGAYRRFELVPTGDEMMEQSQHQPPTEAGGRTKSGFTSRGAALAQFRPSLPGAHMQVNRLQCVFASILSHPASNR